MPSDVSVTGRSHAQTRAKAPAGAYNPPEMASAYSIPLSSGFRFVHEPLGGASTAQQRRFVGRHDELNELASRILLSDGGAFLVTGYRGVGKSTFVNRVIQLVDARIAESRELLGPVDLIDVHLNVPRQMDSVELMFHILRGLYQRLQDKGILELLDRSLLDDLELAFRRTSQFIAIKNASGIEGTIGVTLGLGLPIDKGTSKIALSSRRSRNESREMKYLAYDDKAAEYDLIHVARRLTAGYAPAMPWWQWLQTRLPRFIRNAAPARRRLKVVFVFDELDKIEDVKGSADAGIDAILANLKTLFTTSGICFVFVAGRGTHDRWLDDLGLGDSIYESVFSYARYLQPMWTHADELCNPFLDDGAFRSLEATELATAYSSFKKFLAFNGRGIPRRILRKFNERVRWDDAQPTLTFSQDDVRQFRFFADLQDLLDKEQRTLLGELQDDGFSGRSDRQRLALYYLMDWILLQGVDAFGLADAVAAIGRFSSRIAPDARAAPQLAGRLLTLLYDRQYLERTSADWPSSGAPPPEATVAPRYRLTRRRLIEMGSLAGVLEAAAQKIVDDERSRKFGERYDIVSVIAHGGMSTVYLAEDRQLSRAVAIKEQLRETTNDPRVVQRFRHEAEVLATLSHPNIVRVIDQFLDAHPAYLVLEYVDGAPLVDVIGKAPFASQPVMLHVAREIVRTVSVVHQRGVLWLDPKPSNIILTTQGEVVLLDFGIARLQAQTDLDPGIMLGTPAYCSPEQLRKGPLDERSDIYAVGVVIYQMFTGRLPFDGDPMTMEMAAKRLSEPPIPPSTVRTIPASVEQAILRCLETDPERRFSSAEDLLEALTDEPLEGRDRSVLIASVAAAVRTFRAQRADSGTTHDTRRLTPDTSMMLGIDGAPPSPAPMPQPPVVAARPTPRPPSTRHEPRPPTVTVAAPRPATGVISPSVVAASPTPPSEASARLESPTGEVYVLDRPEIKIGRHASNDIVVIGSRVSRYHASLQKVRDGWQLVDRNTRNGTRVNGTAITAPRLLRNDDMIVIDETTLVFSDPSSASSAVAAGRRFRQGDLKDLLERINQLATASVDDILAGVLDAAIELGHAERGFVLLAAEGDRLEVSAARARGGVHLPGTVFSTSRKIPDQVFRTHQEMLVTDLLSETDLTTAHIGTVALGVRHVHCLPILVHGSKNLGVLYLDSREKGVEPTDYVRAGLQILIGVAARALETAAKTHLARVRNALEEGRVMNAVLKNALSVRPIERRGPFYSLGLRLTKPHSSTRLIEVVTPDADTLGMALIDVAGKDNRAPIIAKRIYEIVPSSQHRDNPTALLDEINRAILDQAVELAFAPVFYGVLSIDGRFVYANAGHEMPAVFPSRAGDSRTPASSLPLGLSEQPTCESASIQLVAGDHVVAFTANVVEAKNGSGEEFGADRVRGVVNDHLADEPGAMAEAVIEAVTAFASDYQPLAVLAVRYLGPSQPS